MTGSSTLYHPDLILHLQRHTSLYIVSQYFRSFYTHTGILGDMGSLPKLLEMWHMARRGQTCHGMKIYTSGDYEILCVNQHQIINVFLHWDHCDHLSSLTICYVHLNCAYYSTDIKYHIIHNV